MNPRCRRPKASTLSGNVGFGLYPTVCGGGLEKWLNGSDEPRSYGRLAALGDTADVFRLENASGPDYLLFKVFAYAYALYRDLWVLPQFENDTDEAVGMQFRQFRRLLELVAKTRKAGANIGSYNLLDFDDRILKVRLGDDSIR